MPTFEIVCLANSRKWHGRCVAGLRTDGQGWLRPVGPNAQGVLHPHHYTLPDGTEPQMLDVLRVSCSRPQPTSYHPEDWLVMPLVWELVSRPLPDTRLAWLQSCLTPGPNLLGSSGDRFTQTALEAHPAAQSLALIAPQNLQWLIKISKEGERRPRVLFTLDGADYNLPLTDPVWEARLLHLPEGTHPRQAARLDDEATVWLTISLGEPFAPTDDAEPCCYKLVAAVIVVPTPGKPQPPSDNGKQTKQARSRVAKTVAKTLMAVRDLSAYPDPFADDVIVPIVVPIMPAHQADMASTASTIECAPATTPPPAAVSPDRNDEAEGRNTRTPEDLNTQGVTLPPDRMREPRETATVSSAALPQPLPSLPQTISPKSSAWTPEADVALLDLLQAGKSIDDIAAHMERPENAIRSRLKLYGLI